MIPLIITGIVLLALLMIGTMLGILVYSGLFSTVHVDAGKPPIASATIAYKYGRGPYQNVGYYFTEITSIAPKHRSMGLYYDDPKQVPGDKLRWVAACILAEGFEMVDAHLWSKFQSLGYRLFQLPLVSNVVKTTFPYRTPLSIFFGIWKVYPRLGQYVKEKKLCAHPCVEIYDESIIHYMAPLSKQDEFYVPEALQPLDDVQHERVPCSPQDNEESREPTPYPAELARESAPPVMGDRVEKDRHDGYQLYGLQKSEQFTDKSDFPKNPSVTNGKHSMKGNETLEAGCVNLQDSNITSSSDCESHNMSQM